MSNSKSTKIQTNINKLDEIIKYFEETDGKFDLDKAIENYEQAMKLVHDVKKELESVELKISEIKEKYNIDEETDNDPTPEMPF